MSSLRVAAAVALTLAACGNADAAPEPSPPAAAASDTARADVQLTGDVDGHLTGTPTCELRSVEGSPRLALRLRGAEVDRLDDEGPVQLLLTIAQFDGPGAYQARIGLSAPGGEPARTSGLAQVMVESRGEHDDRLVVAATVEGGYDGDLGAGEVSGHLGACRVERSPGAPPTAQR